MLTHNEVGRKAPLYVLIVFAGWYFVYHQGAKKYYPNFYFIYFLIPGLHEEQTLKEFLLFADDKVLTAYVYFKKI